MVQRLVHNPNTRGLEMYLMQNGVDTPKALRKPGLWPVNPYTVRRFQKIQNSCALWYPWWWPEGEYFIDSFIPFNHPDPVPPENGKLLEKLAAKWRQTDLNVGMYFSPEGRESIEMVGESLMRMSNSARSLRKGDFGGFLRHLNSLPRSARKESARAFEQGDLSASFLAAHLGWEPIIKDAFSFAENIKPLETTTTIKASAAGTWDMGFGNNTYPTISSIAREVKVRRTIEIVPKRPPSFAERFGLANPFSIAWELVPLSFVADYFLPIGRTIDNLGFISGLWNSKGWQKDYAKCVYDAQMQDPKPVIGASFFPAGTVLRRRYSEERFTRSQFTLGFTAPFNRVKATLPTSFLRLGTLSALTHQRILSLSQKR